MTMRSKEKRGGWKLSPETKLKMTIYRTGRPKKKRHTEDKVCPRCNVLFSKKKKEGHNQWAKRKFCSKVCYGLSQSRETRQKISKTALSQNRRIVPETRRVFFQRIRQSLEYKLWREAVFKRDNYTCVWCGQQGRKLNADHIKPFAYFPELRFAIDNGRTLCVDCHRKTDTWGYRKLIDGCN